MKNLYFLAAVAAFVLGSCTVKEALDPPAGPEDEVNAIGFGTFLDRAPQNGIKPLADILDIDGLKARNPGFRVEAYTSGTTSWNDWNDGARTATPNFMSDQPVTWSDGGDDPGTWTYSPIKYWPRTGSGWANVHFFAYISLTGGSPNVTFAPAGATNGDPQLYCTMPSAYSTQRDLIVDAEYNVTHDTDNGKVKFKFDHVLSRIGFQAQLQDTYAPATVTISSLDFYYNGLCISGTYTFNSGTGDGSDKNNKAGKWDVTGGRGGNNTGSLVSSSSPATLTTMPYDISGTYTPRHYLMLIPQRNAANQAYVLVTYVIHYPTTPLSQTNTVRAYLPETTPTWEPGKAYTYTLNIALNAVKIDVEEANWTGWDVLPPIDAP
jgi:hypothetical protein